MSTSLFNEFNEVSAKAWKQQIQAELKGADFNEKLVTKTEDGIDIKPFYHLDDTDNFTEISTQNWNICQCFDIEDDSQLPIVLDAVERGAEQIWLQVSTTSTSIDAYLIALNKMQIKPFVSFLQTRLTALKKLISMHANQAVFYFDPIAKLGKTGNWYANQKTDLAFLKELSSQPNFTLCLALQHYQHAGANHVQQLAYAMAHLNEYLNQAENQQYTQQIKRVYLHVAIGSNYFFEIAKLRALRVLVYSLLQEYDIDIPIQLIATPSIRNKTLFDYNVNMLRTTTECMSAILGSADVVCNLNYDAIYHKENEFANRISRNQLLILKNESYFDKVKNPADGSFYIEKITQQMQEKALALFKNIEQGQGLIKQLFEGKIQKKIQEQDAKQRAEVLAKNKKLVGTNAYQDKTEKINPEFEKQPFIQNQPRKTLIKPIVERRLAEEIEKERIANAE